MYIHVIMHAFSTVCYVSVCCGIDIECGVFVIPLTGLHIRAQHKSTLCCEDIGRKVILTLKTNTQTNKQIYK